MYHVQVLQMHPVCIWGSVWLPLFSAVHVTPQELL